MTAQRALTRRSHSVAELDATLVRLWAESPALEHALARRGVSLAKRARRSQRQPLLLELWRVRNGQLMVGSLPLRDACAVAYAGLLAAPIALAQAVGVTRRDGRRPAESLSRLSKLGASLGRDGADLLIDQLGSYHEVMLSVPDMEHPTGAGRCRLVLAMLTDSRLSQLGAAGFGFRLGKRMAHIIRDGFHTYRVASATGTLIDACFEASWASTPSRIAPEWQSWLQQPLLGVEQPGSGSTSQLSYTWTDAKIAQVERGELSLAPAVSEELCSERVLIAPNGQRRVQAFHARKLRVQLSYPVGHRWGSVTDTTLHGA